MAPRRRHPSAGEALPQTDKMGVRRAAIRRGRPQGEQACVAMIATSLFSPWLDQFENGEGLVKRSFHLACLALAVMLAATGAAPQESAKPTDIVDAVSLAPRLVLDIRYATRHNFLGRPVHGYEASRCLLTRKAALALSRVEATLRGRGYALEAS